MPWKPPIATCCRAYEPVLPVQNVGNVSGVRHCAQKGVSRIDSARPVFPAGGVIHDEVALGGLADLQNQMPFAAQDFGALAALYDGMRERMKASPLTDGKGLSAAPEAECRTWVQSIWKMPTTATAVIAITWRHFRYFRATPLKCTQAAM